MGQRTLNKYGPKAKAEVTLPYRWTAGDCFLLETVALALRVFRQMQGEAGRREWALHPSGDEMSRRPGRPLRPKRAPWSGEDFNPKPMTTAPEHVGVVPGSRPAFPARWILKHANVHGGKGFTQATKDGRVNVHIPDSLPWR